MMSPLERLVERVRAGDERGLARALRLIDEQHPARLDLMRALHPYAGQARVLGITGNPGVGKSTLVEQLITAHREKGLRVGVVAVDPTSPFSGGAILGDRIRMQKHFLDEGVFIRSLATRGHMGGLTRSADEVITAVDAAGYDVVLVETVGVGQDELEVARLAQTTIVVMAPGLGDDIQANKAGILEVADVFAVNKSDRPGADTTVAHLQQMVALGGALASTQSHAAGHSGAAAVLHAQSASGMSSSGRWEPPIVKTVAVSGRGIPELLAASDQHGTFLSETAAGGDRLALRREAVFAGLFRDALHDAVTAQHGRAYQRAMDEARLGSRDPYTLVQETLDSVVRPGVSQEWGS